MSGYLELPALAKARRESSGLPAKSRAGQLLLNEGGEVSHTSSCQKLCPIICIADGIEFRCIDYLPAWLVPGLQHYCTDARCAFAGGGTQAPGLPSGLVTGE